MSERLIVIGITGEAGAGKDTVAAMLGHRHDFFRIALADGVRASFRDLDGITEAMTKELERAGKTKRWGLQRVGGEAREMVAMAAKEADIQSDDPDWHASHHINRAWVYLVAIKIAYLSEIHPVHRHRFVIPDISFKHEPETLDWLVREMGGRYETWRIDRPGTGLVGVEGQHSSEEGRRSIRGDVQILNRGTKADLELSVEVYAQAATRR